MQSLARLLYRNWQISSIFFLLAAVYLWGSLTNEPDQATLDKYNISSNQLHLLVLTIAIPYIIIWAIGLVGYLRLRSYTKFLGKGKDGVGFRTVARGVFLFTLWLPVSTLLASLASRYYGNHPATTEELTWLVNYVNLLILLPAFFLINQGAEYLVRTTKAKWVGMSRFQIIAFTWVMAIYVFVTFQDSARNVPASAGDAATYYMPDWVILLTIILPRIFMWFLGLSAAASIILYGREVKGTIYKIALRYVALGIAGVVIASIVLTMVQSLTAALNDLSLAILLLLIYLLLIVIGVGYVLIAKGTKQLQKIEES
jgi:hypothetical protein